MTTNQFWLDVRQGLLMIVAAIERELHIEPKTAELRKEAKALKAEKARWSTDGIGNRYPENQAAIDEMLMKRQP